ncbi:MAG: dTDP-4-amino-4,6-dideoxy-D-galactose acyltransferase [Patiriisocius sp.]|jgi:dTDP-4-amino-4,6-dideoxy-D-galactose acyltransferase
MVLKRLTWDSDFFGYETGKIALKSSKDFDFKNLVKIAKPYTLVTIFSKEEIAEDLIQLVDTKIVLNKYIAITAFHEISNENICSFEYSESSYKALKELALISGAYSRFNLDSNFKNDEYKKLYSTWIDNLVLKQQAFDICIYKEAEDILGFTSIEEKSKKVADIGLVAVSNHARGKGIGTQLIERALLSAIQHGYDEVQVVTQKENIPAIKLYEKCGFKQSELTYVYHYWNL